MPFAAAGGQRPVHEAPSEPYTCATSVVAVSTPRAARRALHGRGAPATAAAAAISTTTVPSFQLLLLSTRKYGYNYYYEPVGYCQYMFMYRTKCRATLTRGAWAAYMRRRVCMVPSITRRRAMTRALLRRQALRVKLREFDPQAWL